MTTSSICSPQNSQSQFPWLRVVLFCISVTFILLGPTVGIPFYLSDDSPSLKTAHQLLDKMVQGEWLSGFEGNPGERRYFPGFYYYQILRLKLLGHESVAWHVFHLIGYALLGVVATWFSWRMVHSVWPGFLVVVLFYCTGEVANSSHWMNFVSLPTFEPPLTFLWLVAVYLFCQANLVRGKTLQIIYLLSGSLLTLWSVIFKETSFLIVCSVIGMCSLLLWWQPWTKVKTRNYLLLGTLGVVFLLSFAWGVHVYTRLPKDQGYGGMSSLALSPKGIWDGYIAYKNLFLFQSDYLIPIGLTLLLTRLTLTGPKTWTSTDFWAVALVMGGIAQITSLTIWPFYEGRYIMPAYMVFLIVTCCEFYRLLQMLQSAGVTGEPIKKLYWLVGLLVPILWARLANTAETFEVFLRYYTLIVFLAGVILLYSRRVSEKAMGAIIPVSIFFGLIPIGLVLMLQAANLKAFIFTEYHAREGVRHKAVHTVAKTAPQDAAIYWIVNPDNEGHAWSSAMHLELFYGRPDLMVGPSSWVISQRAPRKGDILLNYTYNINLPLEGTGTLTRLDEEDGGPVFGAKTPADIRKMLVRALFYPQQFTERDLALDYMGVRIPVYTVTSDNWTPSESLTTYFPR